MQQAGPKRDLAFAALAILLLAASGVESRYTDSDVHDKRGTQCLWCYRSLERPQILLYIFLPGHRPLVSKHKLKQLLQTVIDATTSTAAEKSYYVSKVIFSDHLFQVWSCLSISSPFSLIFEEPHFVHFKSVSSTFENPLSTPGAGNRGGGTS